MIGLPDEKWGERVVAALQLQSVREAMVEDIQVFVKARLSSVKSAK